MKSYDEYPQKLGNHLGTTVNAYNSALLSLKIDKDVVKIPARKLRCEGLKLINRTRIIIDDPLFFTIII